MQQLQQERAAASSVVGDIIQPILDEVLVMAVLDSEVPPSVSFPETPDSPAYCPPEIEDEDEDEAMVEESVSYECTECQRREDNKFEIMMHLEMDHGLPDDEDILRMKVREIKTKDSGETPEIPDTTAEVSVQENNN